jgi:hypothetical protein
VILPFLVPLRRLDEEMRTSSKAERRELVGA